MSFLQVKKLGIVAVSKYAQIVHSYFLNYSYTQVSDQKRKLGAEGVSERVDLDLETGLLLRLWFNSLTWWASCFCHRVLPEAAIGIKGKSSGQSSLFDHFLLSLWLLEGSHKGYLKALATVKEVAKSFLTEGGCIIVGSELLQMILKVPMALKDCLDCWGQRVWINGLTSSLVPVMWQSTFCVSGMSLCCSVPSSASWGSVCEGVAKYLDWAHRNPAVFV